MAWSFLYFFCLLSAYFVLRPVRDEMGIQGGIKNLPHLFAATFIGMLAAVPLFGWAAARFSRGVLVPAVYCFFVSHLLVFFIAMHLHAAPALLAKIFFVWLSVFNYFIVSVFWSCMSDIFDSEQAKRLFGVIATGGSAGAITGPMITVTLVHHIGIANLFLVSAVLLGGAVLCTRRLFLWASTHMTGQRQSEEALGGSIFAGLRQTLTNPYLLGISGYILLVQILGTFFYLQQTQVIAASLTSSTARTQLFAQLDLAVNALTLLFQLFVTPHIVMFLGLTACLILLPILSAVGLLTVGVLPTLTVVAVASILRRSTEFAIAKPAREVLFTVVSREERYKAKNVIDTLISRGGDALSGWSYSAVETFGATTQQMAFATLPLAFAMIAVGVYLGRRQETLRAATAVATST